MICVGYKTWFSKKAETSYYAVMCEFPLKPEEGVGKDVYMQFLDKEVYEMLTPEFIGKNITFDKIQVGRFDKIVGVSCEVTRNGRDK